MKLIIISGRSGSGKSSALHALEDQNFYCVDNIPASMLSQLALELKNQGAITQAAVSIDARNIQRDLALFPEILNTLKEQKVDCEVIYLDALEECLLKRFSETRRRHPLSSAERSLSEAILAEQTLLSPLQECADLCLDTSQLSLHELRRLIRQRVGTRQANELALLFQSFGFKRGIPIDADYVFDVRCLPNPYWHKELRQYNGQQAPIQAFMQEQDEVQEMFTDICQFIQRWLPRFENNNRSYMTIAIGCTGGHHRSVYLSQKLCEYFSQSLANVQVRHRELPCEKRND